MKNIFAPNQVQKSIIESMVSSGNKGYYPQELRIMTGAVEKFGIDARKFQANLMALATKGLLDRRPVEGGGYEYFATGETVKEYTPAPQPKKAEPKKGKKFRMTELVKLDIAMECKRIRMANPATPLTDLYEAAQRKLVPMEAWHIGVSRSKLQWLADMMERVTVEIPVPPVVEVKPSAPVIDPDEQKFAMKVMDSLGIREMMVDRAADFVSDVIRKVIESGAVDELRHTLLGGTPDNYINHRPVHAEQQIVHPIHNPFPTAAQRRETDKQRLPKVLIVGLIGKQISEISNRFDSVFDLRFQQSDEAITLLEQRAANMDHVLLMGNWISHNHQSAIKSRKIPHKLVWGTLSGLEVVLQNIASAKEK